MHYMSILTTVENNLVRSYLHTLLTDGLRHIEYISRIMAGIEGATGSASLTKRAFQNLSGTKKTRATPFSGEPRWQTILKPLRC